MEGMPHPLMVWLLLFDFLSLTMKAINNKEHLLLLRAIEQAADKTMRSELESLFNKEQEDLRAIFKHYQSLLAQLSICIAEYDRKSHYIKVNLVGPTLRQSRKK